MCQSSPANDEMMSAMVCEGVSGVSDKRESDQCVWCRCFEIRLLIPNKCYNIKQKYNKNIFLGKDMPASLVVLQL